MTTILIETDFPSTSSQPFQGSILDLPHSFLGDAQHVANLDERPRRLAFEPKTELEDELFAGVQHVDKVAYRLMGVVDFHIFVVRRDEEFDDRASCRRSGWEHRVRSLGVSPRTRVRSSATALAAAGRRALTIPGLTACDSLHLCQLMKLPRVEPDGIGYRERLR